MTRPGLLPGVQYLRFCAALLVVAAHSWQMVRFIGVGDLGEEFEGGQIGVDVFFVISGFIMVLISGRGRSASAASFLADRVTRVGPPYWIVTLAMAAVLFVAPSVFKASVFDVTHIVMSLLFIPWPHPNPGLAGAMPLLPVGWTLNYEMLFYALFALAMLVNHARRVGIAVGAILALVSVSLFLPDDAGVWAEFFTHSIMLEFVLGMLIALAVPHLRLSPMVLWALLGVAILVFAVAAGHPVARLSPTRWVIYGLPSALLVLAVVLADRQQLIPTWPKLVVLGDASYALYLVHLFTLGALRAVWPHLPAMFHRTDLVLIAAGVVTSVVASVVFHLYVEKPATARARELRAFAKVGLQR